MTTLARDGSKIQRALDIYQANLGQPNHRQLCITLFQDELEQKRSTAETYYNLCVQKLDAEQRKITDQVITSSRKTKFSSVKLKRGSNEASRVHCFFSRKAAMEYNELHGYDEVVKGIQQPGKPLGTVAAA